MLEQSAQAPAKEEDLVQVVYKGQQDLVFEEV